MKNRIAIWSSFVLVVILLGLSVHTPATIWIGTMLPDGIDVLIKAWKEVLLLALIPLGQWLILRNPQLRRRLAKDRLWWLIQAYVLLHLVMLVVLWQGWWSGASGLLIDLRYLLMFVLAYIVVSAYPAARRWLLGAVVAGAVVVIGFATVQHALPHDALKHIGYGPDTVVPYLTVDRNYDFIRISSTMRGPNPLGAYAASVTLVVLALAAGGRLRERRLQVGAGVLAVLSLVALWYSYSRSAKLALAAGLVVLLMIYRPWQYISRRLLVSLGVLGGTAFAVALAMVWQTTWFSNVVLHTNPVDGSATQSNDEHWRSLVEGSELMLSQPFGAGVGSTGSASLYGDSPLIIENQYLFIAHETGWLGLILFVAIFGIILWRLWLKRQDSWAAGVLAAGIGLAVVGMVLPVWVDDVVSLVWWAMAGIVLAGDIYGKRASHQKATGTT